MIKNTVVYVIAVIFLFNLNTSESFITSIESSPEVAFTSRNAQSRKSQRETLNASPASYLQGDLFSGQIVSGKVTGSLSGDITDEAIDTMTPCDFFKDSNGRCDPTDPVSPCRYCKEKAMRLIGHFTCPGQSSFRPGKEHLYEWRIKPIKQKRIFRSIHICMVHPLTVVCMEYVSSHSGSMSGTEDMQRQAPLLLPLSYKGSKADFIDTCFEVPNAICLDQASKVITPKAVPSNLAAHWSFDSLYSVDESGGGSHLHPGLRAGPPLFGPGASGYINSNTRSIAHVVSQKLQVDQFTVSLWLYLLDDSAGQERSFLSRGTNFQLSIGATNRNLVLTSGKAKGSLLPRRWTHIVIGYTPGVATLYLNGMLDQRTTFEGGPAGKADIVIGKVSDESPPAAEAYIDEIRIYNTILSADEVASLTIPSLTGISDPDLVRCGCLKCDEDTAKSPTTCPGNYHLCYRDELLHYGFRIARVQGYLTGITGVWMADQLPAEDVEDDEEKKSKEMDQRLALCCLGCVKCAEAAAKMAATT